MPELQQHTTDIHKYNIGWICALGLELAASKAMLDESYGTIHDQDPQDHNVYTLGQVAGHNVVMACLPAGNYGTDSAATVAKDMLRTFTSIKLGLMVGIGGGVPTEANDIRLGDVVVSKPANQDGGVIKYDMGKVLPSDVFERRGSLNKPPEVLLNAVSNLISDHEMEDPKLSYHLSKIWTKRPKMREKYANPGKEHDHLYGRDCEHGGTPGTCDLCQDIAEVPRKPRHNKDGEQDEKPVVHYGLIASGNKVIASARERDRLRRDADILCFEMEAAGLMDRFPCIVIRGISDYADSHKRDGWQRYAAATAAACTKELLGYVPRRDLASLPSASMSMSDYSFGLNLADAPQIEEQNFIGRQSELETLFSSLNPDAHPKSQRVKIVSGLGGMGKTQLAIAFAKRYQTSFSSIFWINAQSETLLRQQLRNISQRVQKKFGQVGISSGKDDSAMVEYLREWLSRPENQQWLLIFDNYDDPRFASETNSTGYDIKKYFPHRAHGSIIITSRSARFNFGYVLEIKKLETAQAIDVLLHRSGRSRASEDPLALVKRLDGLPLALATAGDYLRDAPMSFAEYLKNYEESWSDLDDVAKELPDYEGRTLYSTWNITFAKIRENSAEAAMLLKFLAYFDNQDIWFELLQKANEETTYPLLCKALKSKIKFDATMRHLYNFSLVEFHASAGKYSLHKCVQDWTLHCLNVTVESKLYWTAYFCVASESTQELPADRRLWQHANRLTHDHFQTSRECARDSPDAFYIHLMGRLFLDSGNYKWAEATYLQTIEKFGKDFEVNDLWRLNTFANLIASYECQYKYESAIYLCNQVLPKVRRSFGERHPNTLRLMMRLGQVYRKIGRESEAKQALEQALEGLETTLGPAHILTLQSTHALGSLYKKMGNVSRAEEMYQHALTGIEDARLQNDDMFFRLLFDLAEVRFRQYNFSEAETLWQRAAANRRYFVGPSHVDSVDTVSCLAKIYIRQGRLNEAMTIWWELGISKPRCFADFAKYAPVEFIQALLDDGIQVDAVGTDGQTALHEASEVGNCDAAKYLIGRGADVNSRDIFGHPPLIIAAKRGQIGAASLLLNAGAEINAVSKHGQTPLHYASFKRHTNMVKLLLQHGANVHNQDNDGYTALMSAASYDETCDIARSRPEKEADVENPNCHRLASSVCDAEKSQYDTISVLLENGALVDTRQGEGRTVLMLAAYHGNVKVVRLLLEKESVSQVEARENEGFTALMLAAQNGHGDVVSLLLERGCDVNARANQGQTALYLAAMKAHVETVELLLSQRSIDINACTDMGDTLLITCANGGRKAIVELLLACPGLDIEWKAGDGLTALDIALDKGHDEIASLLRNASPSPALKTMSFATHHEPPKKRHHRKKRDPRDREARTSRRSTRNSSTCVFQ